MCLITCVFEDFGEWEEIRVAFFPVPETFRGGFRRDVWMASDTAASEQRLRQVGVGAVGNRHGGAWGKAKCGAA